MRDERFLSLISVERARQQAGRYRKSSLIITQALLKVETQLFSTGPNFIVRDPTLFDGYSQACPHASGDARSSMMPPLSRTLASSNAESRDGHMRPSRLVLVPGNAFV